MSIVNTKNRILILAIIMFLIIPLKVDAAAPTVPKITARNVKTTNLLRNSSAEKTSSIEYVGVNITDIIKTNLNKEMTISFDIKTNSPGNVAVYSLGRYETGFYKSFPVTTSYQRISVTGKFGYKDVVDPNGEVGTLSFYATYGTGRLITVKNIQIEEGVNATPYFPHVLDIAVGSQNPKTNGDVAVSIEYSQDSVTKQYKIDEGAWTNYTTGLTIKNNSTIYARGINSMGETSPVATYSVTEIDRVAPVLTLNSNGNSSPLTSQSSTIITNDDKALAGIKYQWNQSTTPTAGQWLDIPVGQFMANYKYLRSTEAYTRGLVKVGANVPTYELGRFGKGISIEPATKNVYSYPTFNTANENGGWSHWNQAGGLGTHGQTTDKTFIHGDQTYAHYLNNPSNATGSYLLYQAPTLNGAPGVSSLIVVARMSDDSDVTEDKVYPAWNGKVAGGATPYKWTSVKRIGATRFFEMRLDGIKQDGTNDLVGVYVKPGNKVYFSKMQLERKPYSTTFTESTRAADSFTINTTDILGYREGTVEGYWIPRQPIDTMDNQQLSPPIVQIGNYHSPNSFILWVINKKLSLLVRGGTGDHYWSTWGVVLDEVETAKVYEVDKPLHYAIKWKNAKDFWVTVNGETYGPYTIPDPLTGISGNFVGFGNYAVSAGENNFTMDNFRISNIARTDKELKDSYLSNSPVGRDKNTTYLNDFEDNNMESFGGTVTQETGNGKYYLHVKSTDMAGNTSSATSKEFILDNISPNVVISPNGATVARKTQSTQVTVTDDLSIGDIAYMWTKYNTFPITGSWNTIRSDDSEEQNLILWVDTKDGSNANKTKVLRDKTGKGNDISLQGFNFDGNLNSGWHNGELRLDGLTNLLKTPYLTNVNAIEMTVKMDGFQAADYWNYLVDAREGLPLGYMANRGTGTGWFKLYVDGSLVTTDFNNIPRDRWVKIYIESKTEFEGVINLFARFTDNENLKGSVREIKIYSKAVDLADRYTTSKLNITQPSGDGDYYLHVKAKDVAGNEKTASSNKFVLDNTAPIKPNIIQTNSEWTNAETSVEITYSEQISVKEYKIGDGAWTLARVDNNRMLLSIPDNTKVYAREKDVAENMSETSQLDVTNIDKVMPEVVIVTNGSDKPGKDHSTVVNVKDLHSGISKSEYKWDTSSTFSDGGSWLTFSNGQTIVNKNLTGDYYLHIRVTDKAGNVTKVTSKVFKSDSIGPVITLSPNGNTNTYKEHSVDIQVTDEGSGIDYYEYTWSSSQTRPSTGWNRSPIYDGYFQPFDKLIHAASGSTIAHSSGILKLTSTNNDPMLHLENDISTLLNPNDYRYVEMKYRITNRVATSWEIFFTTTMDGTSIGENRVDGGKLIADGEWHTAIIDGWDNPRWKTRGNIKGFRLDYATTQGVDMEIDYVSISKQPVTIIKGVTGDRYLHVKAVDKAGNETYIASNVFKLKNELPKEPTFTLSTTNWTNGNVTVTVAYDTDQSRKEYKIGTGQWVQYTAPFTVGTNTTVYARSEDNYGNSSSEVSRAITNIDKAAPIIEVTGITTGWVNEVNTTINVKDSASGFEELILPKSTVKTNPTQFKITENGNYMIKAKDKAGNIGEYVIVVDNINTPANIVEFSLKNSTKVGEYHVLNRGEFYAEMQGVVEEKDGDSLSYNLTIKDSVGKPLYSASGVDINIVDKKGSIKEVIWLLNDKTMDIWPDGVYTVKFTLKEVKYDYSVAETNKEFKFILLRENPPTPWINISSNIVEIAYPGYSTIPTEISNLMKKEYSIGNGGFKKYTSKFNAIDNGVKLGDSIYAKYSDFNGNTSTYICTVQELKPGEVPSGKSCKLFIEKPPINVGPGGTVIPEVGDVVTKKHNVSMEDTVIGTITFINTRRSSQNTFYADIFNKFK